MLAAEGLVTMKVRAGAHVTEMSEKDLRDVYHLLSLLESDAAGVVAERATDWPLKSPCIRDRTPSCQPPWPTANNSAVNERFPCTPAGDGRQPLAQPDGGRPAR